MWSLFKVSYFSNFVYKIKIQIFIAKFRLSIKQMHLNEYKHAKY